MMFVTLDRLDRIEALVEANAKAIAALKEELVEANAKAIAALKEELVEANAKAIAKLEEDLAQSQRWQDRTWDAIKFIGGISTSLAIATTVALIGVLLRVAG